MKINKRKILITGGSGFIGSHLVRRLLELSNEIIILDNFSTGRFENLRGVEDRISNIIEGDIQNLKDIEEALDEVDIIFHYAADPYVKDSVYNPVNNFEINVMGTLNLLEVMRKVGIKQIVFASSGGTLYGDVKMDKIPTKEDVQFNPISPYGASKASCESYLSAYSSSYDFIVTSVRFANIYGPFSDHGVMYDFFHKLKQNKEQLEILGDGSQIKSYMYISDCIDATLIAAENTNTGFEAFNLGVERVASVNEIANLVVKEMNLKDVEYIYTGGERGWVGDVKRSSLSIEKIKSLGWKPKFTLKEGVRKYINWLKEHENY
ncbi:MAG: NAD-dependent epimerase/dehydratase family protein [Promethearchaeota archaeon]|nr:MAG: NAD-dependent epimerase/dehydratase family protein [Candidatus Lokiarchaeota archaeon]